ncbi:MAG: PfkB family carbohydrate kinase [Cyanobacteria bacterium J06633_2]
MSFRGLFVGLTTLDCIYQVESIPQSNQKVVAIASTMAAGGPATSAAVAFQHLGNQATILSVVGQHPVHHLVTNDVRQQGVAIADLVPMHTDPPPVSSIFVTQKTGDRAVVSMNATKYQAKAEQIPSNILQVLNHHHIDIVLIDGHQMAVGAAIAAIAKQHGILVVVDGGSWKSGFESVLKYADVAICSANFFPPGCTHHEQVIAALANFSIPYIAITRGDRPILCCADGEHETLPVPPVQAVDTLGAGDIFHGAWCHYALSAMQRNASREYEGRSPLTVRHFVTALEQAAAIATHSCQFFGTRQWMQFRM